MELWSIVRFFLFSILPNLLMLQTSYVTAEPTITTRILRGDQGTLTVTCETKTDPHRNILQLENEKHFSAVNASGSVIFQSSNTTDVKVTESSGLRQVNTEVTDWSEDTMYTCSTLISVTNATFLSRYTREAPIINQGKVKTPNDLSLDLSPQYVVFSESARLYGSVEFMCVSNFISVDTETFRWSLTSTSSGKNISDDELVGISNTGVFIQIESSPMVSTLQINGLNFQTVPDDFVVKCSARLNADEPYVTASSTVQITNQSTLVRRGVINIILGCATGTFCLLFMISIIVIFVKINKKRRPRDPSSPRPKLSKERDNFPKPPVRTESKWSHEDDPPTYDNTPTAEMY